MRVGHPFAAPVGHDADTRNSVVDPWFLPLVV